MIFGHTPTLWVGILVVGWCHVIKTKVTVVKVMYEFIPKEIHQTHTGQWSLVN